MEFLLPQSAERRPAADIVRELRLSCQTVLGSADFGSTVGDRIAELVPPGHPLRSDGIPTEDLAVAVLDPIRDPDRYGGKLEQVEARWQQLGAWVADLGMPDDACHNLVRAVARAARDVSGEDWDSASSSGWAALQMWMQAHLDEGARQARSGAQQAAPPVSPAPDEQPGGEYRQEPQPDYQREHQSDYQRGYEPEYQPEHHPEHRAEPQGAQAAGRLLQPAERVDPFANDGLRPVARADDQPFGGAFAAAAADQPEHPVDQQQQQEPAPPAAAPRGRPGRRQNSGKVASAWSNSGGLDAMSLGGAPPAALRAMRRAMGQPEDDDPPE